MYYMRHTHTHTRLKISANQWMFLWWDTHEWPIRFGWKHLDHKIHCLVLFINDFFFVLTTNLTTHTNFTSFWAISHKFSISKQLMLAQQHYSLWTWNFFIHSISRLLLFFFCFSLPFFLFSQMWMILLRQARIVCRLLHSSYLTAPLIGFDVLFVSFSYICHLDICDGVGIAAYMSMTAQNVANTVDA